MISKEVEAALLTETNGLLRYPITYAQANPRIWPVTAQKLRDAKYKEIKYNWSHTPTGVTGISTLWVSCESDAQLLIEYWNRCGDTWQYSLLETKKPEGEEVIVTPKINGANYRFVYPRNTKKYWNKYIGLTYPRIFGNRFVRAIWKRFLCTKNKHLLDECLTINKHTLECDACGLSVHVSCIETP